MTMRFDPPLPQRHVLSRRCRPVLKPKGVFTGRNFMTRDIVGYYRLRDGYAELSRGEGLFHQPIFGVTVKPDPDYTRSQLFQSEDAAMDYIASLTE